MRILIREKGVAINKDSFQEFIGWGRLKLIQGNDFEIGGQITEDEVIDPVSIEWADIQTALTEAGITDLQGDIEAQRLAHKQEQENHRKAEAKARKIEAQNRRTAALALKRERDKVKAELRKGGLSIQEQIDRLKKLAGI